MLSPSTRQTGRSPMNVSPIRKACARPPGLGLHRVGQVQAPLRAVAQQVAERVLVAWRGDDQDLADAGEHQRRQRVVDHRLVVDRHQLLADRAGERVQARAAAAREHDAAVIRLLHEAGSSACGASGDYRGRTITIPPAKSRGMDFRGGARVESAPLRRRQAPRAPASDDACPREVPDGSHLNPARLPLDRHPEALTLQDLEPVRPLRICLLGYRSHPFGGGQGVYLRYLSKALLELGHRVDVISGPALPASRPRRAPDPDAEHEPLRDRAAVAAPAPPALAQQYHRVAEQADRRLRRAAGLRAARAALPARAPRRLRHRARQPEPELRHARAAARGRAAGHHDPSPDHQRPAPRAGRLPLVVAAAADAPLALLPRHAGARGARAAPRGDGIGVLARRHRARFRPVRRSA